MITNFLSFKGQAVAFWIWIIGLFLSGFGHFTGVFFFSFLLLDTELALLFECSFTTVCICDDARSQRLALNE
jgi:hypothetical protein